MREATRPQSPTVRVQAVIPVILNPVQYTSTPSLDNRQQNSLEGFSIQEGSLGLSDQVTTLAGSAGRSRTTNVRGWFARFNTPNAITTDGTNLYVADEGKSQES